MLCDQYVITTEGCPEGFKLYFNIYVMLGRLPWTFIILTLYDFYV